MLNKNFDMVLVGKSFLSFIFSIELIDQNQNVLILEDERLSYGNLYNDFFNPVQVAFLKTWGEERGIKPLENIEQYLYPQGINYFYNLRQFKIGLRPSLNLIELFRKNPELFSALEEDEEVQEFMSDPKKWDEFDQQILSLANRLGQNAFRYKNVQNFGIEFFLNQANPFMTKVFRAFHRQLSIKNEKANWDLKTLSYLGKSVLHKVLSLKDSGHEAFHLLLHFLGPNYYVDQKALEDDLAQFFKSKGGFYKKTKVREWKFYKNRPWSLELASYEGIIHPEKISFLGALPIGVPLKLGNIGQGLQSINISLKHPDPRLHGDGQELFICGQRDKIGTEHPLFIFKKTLEGLQIQYFQKANQGSKLSFVSEKIRNQLNEDLEGIFPKLFVEVQGNWDFSLGSEIFIEEEREKKKTSLPLVRNVELFDYSSPSKTTKLKNVFYFGPFKEDPLGMLSSLMEMKEVHKFL